MVGLMLFGCAPQFAPLVSPTAIPTSDTDGPALATQEPVDPPRSEESALKAANKTVQADQDAFFGSYTGTVSIESDAEFETGEYLALKEEFTAGADGGTMSGEPNRWVPNLARSSASGLLVDGTEYEFGEATLLGCFQSRSTLVYDSDPSPAPTSTGAYFPTEVVLDYEPARRIWLISKMTSLSDFGATECNIP